MKNIIIIALLTCSFQLALNAQNRSGLLEANEQTVGLATGIDYSIAPLIVSYKRGMDAFNLKYPIVAGVDMSIPVYAFDFNDIRLRLLSEMTLFRKNNFELRGGINPVFVRTKLETETMNSLGLDLHLFTGFTGEKWSVGAEFIYNKIVSTHITHTDKYRDNVLADAVDGWYENTASNIRMGMIVNRRINNFDVHLRTGVSKTGTFGGYLFVPPLYMHIGLNYRF